MSVPDAFVSDAHVLALEPVVFGDGSGRGTAEDWIGSGCFPDAEAAPKVACVGARAWYARSGLAVELPAATAWSTSPEELPASWPGAWAVSTNVATMVRAAWAFAPDAALSATQACAERVLPILRGVRGLADVANLARRFVRSARTLSQSQATDATRHFLDSYSGWRPALSAAPNHALMAAYHLAYAMVHLRAAERDLPGDVSSPVWAAVTSVEHAEHAARAVASYRNGVRWRRPLASVVRAACPWHLILRGMLSAKGGQA